MNRRNFIKTASAGVVASSIMDMGQVLANTQVDSNEYRALVCVFLFGGMDNHDTIIPYDAQSYNKWASIRQSLLNQYVTKREISALLPITTPSRFGSRQFALPPEMPSIAGLYQQGKLSVVGNVGPLLENVNATSIRNETANLPSRLFSHNDQQSTWMSGKAEGAQYGWAGKFYDALINQGSAKSNTFSAVTTAGGELLLTGTNTTPYHVTDGKAATIQALEFFEGNDAVDAHFSALGHQTNNLLEQDLASKIGQSFEANKMFNQAISSQTTSVGEFPKTGLGRQLESVARTLAVREQLGTNRQIFVVSMGGFDTHSGQAQSLPKLQSALDGALGAFNSAMESMGLSNNVTLFTASDFGRTLAINGDGTDHGWGAHHFVMGGAINGGTIFGDIPPAELNHELDAGSGRLIPTMSVDQYGAALGQWLGISDSELAQVFPNLNNFGASPALFA
ncbi:DUF1501 domain-containing protein [Pseudoalteromonas luteoviolacea]|uniref:Tat pathway signal protein n=1 Tax=Pseudoalteromonas luteoviolacea H33 TaxID=1365251 RepID=A0A167EMD0_9GAMM|nr:DUF1501 domain-containing protein [Pseudoalteromonas luteoviolacea]KZN50958.1 hypothetical protein N476_15050 [Pseudoalteromonas luteoviolacea H33]KZN75032.1 hypothetical protein N477_20690 [Pseudoalteromonas luteoviolacea H33-S]